MAETTITITITTTAAAVVVAVAIKRTPSYLAPTHDSVSQESP